MRQSLKKWWNSYKYRFVPWIALNVQKRPSSPAKDIQSAKSFEAPVTVGKVESESIPEAHNHVPVAHVSKSDDILISNSQLIVTLSSFLSSCKYPSNSTNEESQKVASYNVSCMEEKFGFQIKRCKSVISPDAGTGVFVTSGVAKSGSLIALYPGTIYMPYEPLFFPSLGNPFIFRCSDGIHVDGNDRWISKSIYKSCAARDRFDFNIPCCDTTWLSQHPVNPLNIGQYVNNRSISHKNNVVYQEHLIPLPTSILQSSEDTLSLHLWKYLPNVWSDPSNNKVGLKLISLVAVTDISEGEEILSSYFTVVHPEEKVIKTKPPNIPGSGIL